jgi:hypothetical protein
MRAALLLLLLAPALACAQAGRFLLAAGEVTLLRGGKEIRAVAGTAVEQGDTIRVGPRSNVQLRMSDQAIVSLRANTEFRIDEYVYSGRGEDGDRSVFSLIKGGMRTVSGAIARPQRGGLVQTAAKPEAPSGPQPTAEEKKPRDETDSKVADAIRGPLRAVAGALTPTRHAVRVPTATIGIRGTHYTLVHCNNDCFERGRTSVASALLAQSDAGSPGLGNLAPNGTYGGVTDGLIGVVNNTDDKEFGANSFFYVASPDSPVQGLIGPPGFLYDRLEAQDRSRGQGAKETTANMPNSGLNAESRPSDTPTPPTPPQFVVTEERTTAGDLTVVPGDPTTPTAPPPVAPDTAFLSAFTNATGGPDTVAALVDKSALTFMDIGDGLVLVSGFNAPAGSTANPATGAYSGSAANVQPLGSSPVVGAQWGRWFDGSATDASGTTAFSTPGNFFHYLVGPNTPPEVIAAKTGSFGFDLIAGSFAATNNLGESGSLGAGTMRLAVDFTARTVTYPSMAINFQSQPWSFPASTAPITIHAGRGASVSDSVTGSCGPITSCNGTAVLSRTGAFMGPVGDHLGVALQARTLSGTPANMNGTALFRCASSPC